jgi:hypothetical protein
MMRRFHGEGERTERRTEIGTTDRKPFRRFDRYGQSRKLRDSIDRNYLNMFESKLLFPKTIWLQDGHDETVYCPETNWFTPTSRVVVAGRVSEDITEKDHKHVSYEDENWMYFPTRASVDVSRALFEIARNSETIQKRPHVYPAEKVDHPWGDLDPSMATAPR